jgi:hypothetical protein
MPPHLFTEVLNMKTHKKVSTAIASYHDAMEGTNATECEGPYLARLQWRVISTTQERSNQSISQDT